MMPFENGSTHATSNNASVTESSDNHTHNIGSSEDNTIQKKFPPIQERLKRAGAGAGVQRMEPSFWGKEYISVQSKQFLSAHIDDQQHRSILRKAIGIVLIQMSANEGFKRFGERAVAAMIKELKQLNDGAMPGKPAVGPIDPDTLTSDEKMKALEAVNLIKEKRNGNIKGRTCANGKKQRRYVAEGEIISSPTASLQLVSSLA